MDFKIVYDKPNSSGTPLTTVVPGGHEAKIKEDNKMLTLDKFSPSVRSGYADHGQRWRICHDGKKPDKNGSKWRVRYLKNYNGEWEWRVAFSGTLIDCIDYVNDVAEWTD